MSTFLNTQRDLAGNSVYAPAPGTNLYSATLTNGAASSITVPSSHKYWIASFSFQPGTNCWVDCTGATAAVPVGATFASTTSELNPGSRYIVSGTVISVITDATSADVGISLYAVSYP